MPLAVLLAWLATAVVALVDWWAVVGHRPEVERWAKPAVVVGLGAVALLLGAAGTATGWWVLAALALGLLGDVLLLGDAEGRFLGGLAAFLVGHVAWLVAFVSSGLDAPRTAWVGVAVVLVALVVGRAIVPGAHRQGGMPMAAPVALYMAVIAVMACTGWATGALSVGLGATLFVVSDTVLGLGRFDREHRWTSPAVMVTYHLAQALLVLGLLGT